MNDAPLPDDINIEAYRLFLGRKPDDPSIFAGQTFDELVSSLYWSREFQKSPRSKKNGLGWPEAHYVVSRGNKIMYCPIATVDRAYFKRIMAEVADHPQKSVISRSPHVLTDHVKTGLQLSDYSDKVAKGIIGDDEMYRFAVLRDPGRRLLDAYIEKFVLRRQDPVTTEHYTAEIVGAVQQGEGLSEPDHARGISFRAFVEHVVQQPPETLDSHWRPQSLFLGGYDWTLFMLDNISALIAELESRAGVGLDGLSQERTDHATGGAAQSGLDALLPAEIEALTSADPASFIPDDLDKAIRDYFAQDYALIASIS